MILTIQHPAYLAQRVNTSRLNGPEVSVELRKKFHIRGTVTDASTGKRIPEFGIRVGFVMAGRAIFPDNELTPPVIHGANGEYKWTPSEVFEASKLASSRVLAADARGYLRAVSRPIADADGDAIIDFALKKTSISSGTLLFPNGRPVVGAELSLSKKTDMFRPTFVDGRLSITRGRGPRTTTDAMGYFEFPPPNEPFVVIAQHDKGVAIAHQEELRRSQSLELQLWARVNGQLLIGGGIAAGETVVLRIVENEPQPSVEPAFPGAEFTYKLGSKPAPLAVRFQYRAKTDAEGRFSFDRVKPGEVRVEREASLGGMFITHTHSSGGEALPGRTLTLQIARVGRSVEGHVALPPKQNEWDDPCTTNGSASLVRLPRSSTEREMFSLALGPDGHFRATDIPAGEYELTMDVFCGDGAYTMKPSGVVSEHVTVPVISEGEVSAVKLGAIELKGVNTLSVGDPAPSLQLIDLAGTRTRLADLQGKIVLLHFAEIGWDPWAKMTDRLKALYQNRPEKDRVTMISVYLEADGDRVRRFVKERELDWPYLVVIPEEMDEIRSAFGLHRLVDMFLIGAGGTIRNVITDPASAAPAIRKALAGP